MHGEEEEEGGWSVCVEREKVGVCDLLVCRNKRRRQAILCLRGQKMSVCLRTFYVQGEEGEGDWFVCFGGERVCVCDLLVSGRRGGR